MNKYFVVVTALILIVSACVPQTPTEPPSIIIEQPPHTSSGMTTAEIAALTLLSETLGLPADQITLVSSEAVTWPDGCLGIVRMGVMCTQAEVPGYKITFEADGDIYEVHANKDGSVALIAGDPQSSTTVEDAVTKQLAQNLGLKENDISVVSNVAIEFPDSCLGVMMDDVMCAQVITPGRIIVLEANGVQYEYHTNDAGSQIQPATLALTWSRDGGFAGFCDSFTVFLSGEIYGNQCKLEDGRMGTFASLLTSSERSKFDTWIGKYGQVSLDESDPKDVSDSMNLVIEFYGLGKGKPGKPVQQEIFTWAQELFQKLYKQEPAISQALVFS